MKIEFGYNFETNKIIENNKEKTINQDEFIILQSIINILKNKFDINNFSIISNTNNYLTLKYKDFDIARIKYTDKSKWISILILDKKDRLSNEHNTLFDAQAKKSQLQWKSNLTDNDISKYITFLENTCIEINKNN